MNFKIEKREIPYRISEFSDALERIFSVGSRNLEILFMKRLHSKINIFCAWPTWCKWVLMDITFQEYVRLMKQKFAVVEAGDVEVEVIGGASEKQELYT